MIRVSQKQHMKEWKNMSRLGEETRLNDSDIPELVCDNLLYKEIKGKEKKKIKENNCKKVFAKKGTF